MRAQLLIAIYGKEPAEGPEGGSVVPLRPIIVGLSAIALSGAQNSDYPQWKSALNRYWI